MPLVKTSGTDLECLFNASSSAHPHSPPSLFLLRLRRCGAQLVSTNRVLSIDYIMNVTLASQNYTSAFLNYSLYFEYTQSILFYVDHIRGACYPLPLSGQFATVCTDKLPYTFLTSLQVGDQVAALWGNNTASVALSSSCIPIFSRASDAPLGLTVNTFVFSTALTSCNQKLTPQTLSRSSRAMLSPCPARAGRTQSAK